MIFLRYSLLCVFFFLMVIVPVHSQRKGVVKQEKVGWLYKFYRKIFPTEEQKAIREALKVGSKPRLRQEGMALLETPAALKTVIGEFHLVCEGTVLKPYHCPCDAIDNPEKAYIELKGAYELLRQHALPKKDLALLDDIGKFLANTTGNDTYGGRRGYEKWLFEQYTRLEECFGDKIRKTQSEIDTLQQKRNEIELKIEALQDQRMALAQQRQSLETQLTQLSQKRRAVDLQLNASMQNYEKVLKQLDELSPSNDPVWVSEPIAGTDDGIRLVRSATDTDPNWRPNLDEYRLGDHCSGQIRTAVRRMTEALIKQRYSALHDPRAREDIHIKLLITGKADGTKIKNCITYYGEDIQATYYPVEYGYVNRNEPQSVDLRNEQCDVDNSKLGFLRAFCAYKQVREVFDENELMPFFEKAGEGSGEVEFQSEAFTEEGEAYRGVDIQIVIEGLYRHQQREKEKLRGQSQQIKAEETILLRKEESFRKEQEIIDEEIRRLEKLKRYYEEKLLSPSVVQQDVDRIIANLELYESLTNETRKLVEKGVLDIGNVYKYIELSEAEQKLVRKGEKNIQEF